MLHLLEKQIAYKLIGFLLEAVHDTKFLSEGHFVQVITLNTEFPIKNATKIEKWP